MKFRVRSARTSCYTQLMKVLLLTFVAIPLLVIHAKADQFVCPDKMTLHAGDWFFDYQGYLQTVRLTPVGDRTRVDCERESGSVYRWVPARCVLKPEGGTMSKAEGTTVTFYMCRTNPQTRFATNDIQCVVICAVPER